MIAKRHESLLSRSESMSEAQATDAKAVRTARRAQSAGAKPRTVQDLTFKQMKKKFSIANERKRSREKYAKAETDTEKD